MFTRLYGFNVINPLKCKQYIRYPRDFHKNHIVDEKRLSIFHQVVTYKEEAKQTFHYNTLYINKQLKNNKNYKTD